MSGQEKGQGKIAIFLTKQNDKNKDCGTPPGFRGGGRGRSAPRMQPALEAKEHLPQAPPRPSRTPAALGRAPHSFRTWPRTWGLGNKEAKASLGEKSPEPRGPRRLGHHVLENSAPACKSWSSGQWSGPCSCPDHEWAADPGPKNGPAGGVLAFPSCWTRSSGGPSISSSCTAHV